MKGKVGQCIVNRLMVKRHIGQDNITGFKVERHVEPNIVNRSKVKVKPELFESGAEASPSNS